MLPWTATARDVFAYVFRRAAGTDPNVSLPASPGPTPAGGDAPTGAQAGPA